MTVRGSARPTVLVFSGLDPSGGAGISADIEASVACGAHALPVVTALTVQDHNRVFEVQPVDAALIERQARALLAATAIDAVKLGIPGSVPNAHAIARVIDHVRALSPALPVILDPILASGRGHPLQADGLAVEALRALLPLATVATPNLMEHAAADFGGVPHVLVTGGHGHGAAVCNRWRGPGGTGRTWSWPRLDGEFHGSGCTLAASIAAHLARGAGMEEALFAAQAYTHRTLAKAFSIGAGQRIPQRVLP